MSKLDAWLDENIGLEIPSLGLERIKTELAELSNLSWNPKIITVCGTNGKGGTCFELERHLSKLNKSFCIWTSPHIRSVVERFKSHEGHIAEEKLFSFFQKKLPLTDRITYYEFLFVCFVNWIHEVKPEVLVLEVGLGGRLDTVNVFDADVVVLTSIARDHEKILGSSLSQILNEKLGVLRSDTHLIHSIQLDSLKKIITNTVKKKNIVEYKIKRDELDFLELNFCYAKKAIEIALDEKTSLAPSNWGDEERQVIIQSDDKQVYLAGSHNPDGIRNLVQYFRSNRYTFSSKNSFSLGLVIFSERETKDCLLMIKILQNASCIFDQVICSDFDHPRAKRWNGEDLQKLKDLGVSYKKFNHAVNLIKSTKGDVLITGSNYMISKFQEALA